MRHIADPVQKFTKREFARPIVLTLFAKVKFD